MTMEEPFDENTMIVRLLDGKTVYKEQVEAAKRYSSGRGPEQARSVRFQLSFELSYRQLESINDGFVYEAIVQHQMAFESARNGARSSDALSHASALIFLTQMMSQLEKVLREERSC